MIIFLLPIFLVFTACASDLSGQNDGGRGYFSVGASDRVEVLLPEARFMTVFMEDEEGNRTELTGEPEKHKGRFSELYLYVRKQGGSGEYYIPENFEKAVEELREMLPPEYRRFLLERYGYVEPGKKRIPQRKFEYGFDNRIVDLEYFLNDLWQLEDLEKPLSKEIDCMGNFEFDLWPFIR